jgi:Flp pilus assembly protein TadD
MMRSRANRSGNLLATTALLGVLALTAAGCKTPDMAGSGGALGGGLFTSSTPAADAVQDWRREVAEAGQRYQAKPSDADVALRYARALRKTGQNAQAAAVLQQATIHNPNDKRLLGDYGRALAENGRLKEAFEMLDRAHTPDRPDWRVFSAQGAVLDQMGRHETARRYYEAALAIVPDEPSVLSNLGLSYALSKELPKAEETLRKAASTGSKDKRVRQNLALVVGLQGRFHEAQEIARAELPPAGAAENIAYLQEMLPKKSVAAETKTAAAKHDDATDRTGSIGPRTAKKVKPAAKKPTEAAQAKSGPLMLGAGG